MQWRPPRAACRSIRRSYGNLAICIGSENRANLVDRIVDGQVSEGHFAACPITFKDITNIKNVFKEKLRTIYHARISYPELKK